MRYKVAFRTFFTNASVIAATKLSLVWLSGLLLGGFVGVDTACGLSPLFLLTPPYDATFLGIFLVLFIPLLFSVCLRFLFSADAILLVVFLKAAEFALVVVACFCSWGSAGWLISRLLLFSTFLNLPVLIWAWYRILCSNFGRRETFISIILMLIIGLADYFFVSPFLCSLF